MARLVPTALRLISPEWTDRVPAPAHDSLTPAERRAYLSSHPNSYLAVTRAPEDLPPGVEWDATTALEHSRSRLAHLLDNGAFGALAEPELYLYELWEDDHRQTGIVAGVSTDEYDTGRIRIHERVRDDRAEHLATQLGGLGVQSSPIALAHRPSATIASTVEQVLTTAGPLVDFRAADGVRQRVWRVDHEIARALQEALAPEPLYLMDGHHRAAAASQLHRRAPGTDADWILGAVFPADELRTEAFHRILPGTDGEHLLTKLGERLAVRPAESGAEVDGRAANELALFVPGRAGRRGWYLVALPERSLNETDADEFLSALEVVRLELEVLQPLLDLEPRLDSDRITFRAGVGDRQDLARLEAEVTDPVFVMRPIAVDLVMTASDLGAVMPPKSTYFRPKVRSGVFLRPLRTAP